MPYRDAHDGHIERRDYPTRAETLCRVLNGLLHNPADPATSVPWIPDEVAERILRRLACRGLVRRVAGAWLPTAILRNPAHLVPCYEPAP